jgi:hypothetical protein
MGSAEDLEEMASTRGDGCVRATRRVWNTDTPRAYKAAHRHGLGDGGIAPDPLVPHERRRRTMMDCDTFLDGHSDFRDGLLMLPDRVAFQVHLRECDSCARYDRVVHKGVQVLRNQPQLEVSDDFMERLQHRLYHVDDEMANARNRRRRGPVSRGAAAALAAAAAVAAVALVPQLYRGAAPTVTMLPTVAATAPVAETPAYRLANGPSASEGLAAQLEEVGVEVYPMPYGDVLYHTASYTGGSAHGSVAAE